MRQSIFIIMLLIGTISLSAQKKIGIGFRTGLNFSQLAGDSEPNENHDSYTGFHIAASGEYRISNDAGIRLELLFDQKGSKFQFKGDSFLKLNTLAGNQWVFDGITDLAVNINNAYLSIPVTGYYKWRSIEINGGLGIGLLLSSKGDGDLSFTGTGSNGSFNLDIEDEVFLVEANYLDDDAGTFRYDVPIGFSPKERIIVNRQVTFPTYLNAFYDYEEGVDFRKFNSIDFFVQGGLSYYLNRGLFISGRFHYSLIDVTDDDAEKVYSRIGDDNNIIIEPVDKRFFNLQVSLGFTF